MSVYAPGITLRIGSFIPKHVLLFLFLPFGTMDVSTKPTSVYFHKGLRHEHASYFTFFPYYLLFSAKQKIGNVTNRNLCFSV